MGYDAHDFIDDRIDDRIHELAKDHDLLWEGLGPDAFTRMFQGIRYPTREAKQAQEIEYTAKIIEAFTADDKAALGKLMYDMLYWYLQEIAEEQLADEWPEYEQARSEYYFNQY